MTKVCDTCCRGKCERGESEDSVVKNVLHFSVTYRIDATTENKGETIINERIKPPGGTDVAYVSEATARPFPDVRRRRTLSFLAA